MMPEYRVIEIDFDVHQRIEAERISFSETPNDALRRLLNLPAKAVGKSSAKVSGGREWSGEGVTLPHGTLLRMEYNKRRYDGTLTDGKWVVDGKTFDSPSGAASGVAVTKSGKKTRLDGWMYWEVKLPGESQWGRISMLRRKARH